MAPEFEDWEVPEELDELSELELELESEEAEVVGAGAGVDEVVGS